jgi:hypothetical protein
MGYFPIALLIAKKQGYLYKYACIIKKITIGVGRLMMLEIKVNTTKNRLYITIKGKMSRDEIITSGDAIFEKSKQLNSGFGVISDISEFMPLDEEGRLIMQNIMKTVKEYGMGHVVRVIKEDGIAQVTVNQWQRTSRQAGYIADNATNALDAEKKLDELEKS